MPLVRRARRRASSPSGESDQPTKAPAKDYAKLKDPARPPAPRVNGGPHIRDPLLVFSGPARSAARRGTRRRAPADARLGLALRRAAAGYPDHGSN